jgi:hypothetical protein
MSQLIGCVGSACNLKNIIEMNYCEIIIMKHKRHDWRGCCLCVCMSQCLLLYVSGRRAIFRKFCVNVILQEAVPASYFNFLQSTIMNMWPLNLGSKFSGYLRNFNPNLLHLISCWISWVIKIKFHPRTDHEDPDGGRGIAVLFLLISAVDGVGDQCHTATALSAVKRNFTNCTGGWVVPRAGLGGYLIPRPNRSSIPGSSSA